MPSPQTQTQTQTRERPRFEPPRMWNVVLLDDQAHSYEYVIRMVRELFAHDETRAIKIAQSVDKEGRAVCLTTHKEHAELKQEQIHSYGADGLINESVGCMSAIIEPAEFGGEDDEDDSAT